MIRYLLATAAVLSAGTASAGTISRSEQPVIVLFEKGGENGHYVEGAVRLGEARRQRHRQRRELHGAGWVRELAAGCGHQDGYRRQVVGGADL